VTAANDLIVEEMKEQNVGHRLRFCDMAFGKILNCFKKLDMVSKIFKASQGRQHICHLCIHGSVALIIQTFPTFL